MVSLSSTASPSDQDWNAQVEAALAKLPPNGPLMRIFKKIAELDKVPDDPKHLTVIASQFIDSIIKWQQSDAYKNAKDDDDRAEAFKDKNIFTDSQWDALVEVCDPITKYMRVGYVKRDRFTQAAAVLLGLGTAYMADRSMALNQNVNDCDSPAYREAYTSSIIKPQQAVYDKQSPDDKKYIHERINQKIDQDVDNLRDARNDKIRIAVLLACGSIIGGTLYWANGRINRSFRESFVADTFMDLDQKLDGIVAKRSREKSSDGLSRA